MPAYDIILLSGAPEGSFLQDQLHARAPELVIGQAGSREELEKLSRSLSENARLITFCTAVIVSADIINRFRGNCYNFHPAPPEYPGYRPSGFALYHGANRYGVTAHRLIRQIDAGEIVGSFHFKIEPHWNNYELGIAAYGCVIDLFRELVPQLVKTRRLLPPSGENWGPHTYTKKEYLAMKRITSPLPPAELETRFRCFDGIYCPVD